MKNGKRTGSEPGQRLAGSHREQHHFQSTSEGRTAWRESVRDKNLRKRVETLSTWNLWSKLVGYHRGTYQHLDEQPGAKMFQCTERSSTTSLEALPNGHLRSSGLLNCVRTS